MNKETIRNKLEIDGYYIAFSGEVIIVGKYRETDPDLGIVIYDAYCSMTNSDGQIMVDYSQAAIPMEKLFYSESEAIAFIRKQFPLDP